MKASLPIDCSLGGVRPPLGVVLFGVDGGEVIDQARTLRSVLEKVDGRWAGEGEGGAE